MQPDSINVSGNSQFARNSRLVAPAVPWNCCKQSGTGILPVNHGRDAHATRGFARASTGYGNASTKRARSQKGAVSRAAFTLVELLMVLLIIGVLLAAVSGGITYAVENARNRRNATTKLALRTALQTYRHEYGDWPLPSGAPPEGEVEYRDNPPNREVFDRLAADNVSANPRRIAFLEQGQYRRDDDGNIVNPWTTPYRVTFNLDNDTVEVDD